MIENKNRFAGICFYRFSYCLFITLKVDLLWKKQKSISFNFENIIHFMFKFKKFP